MRKRRRLSDAAGTVLELFVNEPDRKRFGLDILKETKIRSGSLYPILHRFEGEGMLKAEWEPLEEATAGRRRPRRLYRLDAAAAASAERALEEWRRASENGPGSKRARLRPA